MTSTEAIADFVAEVSYDRLPENVREGAKRKLLDAIAVGLGSHDATPVAAIREGLQLDGPSRNDSRVWGMSSTGAAPRAAMSNAASVAAGHGPIFPSPTPTPVGGSIATVVAAAEAYGATGETTLAGLAVAFELHGELAWHAPLDERHPATHTAVAGAAGAGRVAGLDETELTNALGIASSRVTVGPCEEEIEPIMTGHGALGALYACILADGGVSIPDPPTASGGWHDLVGAFDLDFDPGCERVLDAAVLPYDSHLYGQPAIEAAIELASENALDPADVESISVETTKKAVPEIDPDRIAAAVVDRALSTHRGDRADLRPIADVTSVTVADDASGSVDAESIPARVTVETYGGDVYVATHERFDGHPAAPASWGVIEEKFHALTGERYEDSRRKEILKTVRGFEAESPTELARLLD